MLSSTHISSAIVSAAGVGGGGGGEATDQRAVPSEGSLCWGQRFWQSPLAGFDLEDPLVCLPPPPSGTEPGAA